MAIGGVRMKGDTKQLLSAADARLKEHEDSIRLAQSLGMDVTLTITPEFGLAMLAMARRSITFIRADQRNDRISRWVIGAYCFAWGFLTHAWLS